MKESVSLRERFMQPKENTQLVSDIGQPDIVPVLKSLGSEFQINAELVFVTPNGETLQGIAKLIEEGHLKPLPVEEYSLNDAKTAQIKSAEGHVRGKLVLRI